MNHLLWNKSWLLNYSMSSINIKATLKHMLGEIKGISDNDLRNYPVQIICLVQQLAFTKNCERAMVKRIEYDLLYNFSIYVV